MAKKTESPTELIEIPSKIASEVKLFIDLLLSGEIQSLSDLLVKAGLKNMLELDNSIELDETALTSDQEKALSELKNFVGSQDKFFRLSGFAGTGKTFLICRLIQWLKSSEITFVAACPTNKGAKNLRNLASVEGLELEVKTIAQLLGQQPELDENTGKEIFICNGLVDLSVYNVAIVDEFSMVSKDNFNEIAMAAKSSVFTKVIFVGDEAQLPPVGEKEPIVTSSDLIEQSARLIQVVRYDGELAKVAEEIRSQGKYSSVIYPFKSTSDESIVCLPYSQWLDSAIASFKSEQFKFNSDYVRFLAWRNSTVDSLNQFVRSKLWPKGGLPYLPGDRLIARKPLFRVRPGGKGKNKWGIAINNSEEALVTEAAKLKEIVFQNNTYKYWHVNVQPDTGKAQPLFILHEDSKELFAEQVKHLIAQKKWSDYFDLSRRFDDVSYAYALTTHKAQGSTIDYVFLDVNDMHSCSDRQKLLYTALTRARKQVFISH